MRNWSVFASLCFITSALLCADELSGSYGLDWTFLTSSPDVQAESFPQASPPIIQPQSTPSLEEKDAVQKIILGLPQQFENIQQSMMKLATLHFATHSELLTQRQAHMKQYDELNRLILMIDNPRPYEQETHKRKRELTPELSPAKPQQESEHQPTAKRQKRDGGYITAEKSISFNFPLQDNVNHHQDVCEKILMIDNPRPYEQETHKHKRELTPELSPAKPQQESEHQPTAKRQKRDGGYITAGKSIHFNLPLEDQDLRNFMTTIATTVRELTKMYKRSKKDNSFNSTQWDELATALKSCLDNMKIQLQSPQPRPAQQPPQSGNSHTLHKTC